MNDTTTPVIESAPIAEIPPRTTRKRVVRALGATALALGLATGGGYIWLNSTSDVVNAGVAECTAVTPDGGTRADLAAVCSTLSAMTAAWDRNDADAYGAQFTENATYTSFVGTHYQGRADLTEGHRALFDGFLKGTKLADSYLGIRFYGSDVAIVTSRGDRYEDKRPAELSKTQTYTLVRESDGAFRIAAFQNTQRQRVMERISFLFAPDTKPRAER